MSEHPPRIRIHAQNGAMLIRDGLSFTFYMCHPHAEVAPAVMHSLDLYIQVVGGHHVLSRYSHEAAGWMELGAADWTLLRKELLNPRSANVHLADVSSRENRYRFIYRGKPPSGSVFADEPGAVCAVSFWLPTEYLEEHGPGLVRELAMELAAPLPFCSGHAGLSFNCETDLVGVKREVLELGSRYPGMDIPDPSLSSLKIGTKVRGASWLTFLGHPVLGELGGAAGLRSRLHSPGATVQELEGERAVVTLGPWPEAGDSKRGDVLPAYRELARVLESWLFEAPHASEEVRRWERRFRD